MHLPRLPVAKSNTLGRLLVDYNTASDLGWALLETVDLSSTIDGMPLLQAFCLSRQNRKHAIPGSGDFRTAALPISVNDPWPDSRREKKDASPDLFHSPEMWIAASLICNGSDPFAWRTEDGKDVLDFAIHWSNPQILDQLLHLPSCPPTDELQKRIFSARTDAPWLHGLALAEDHKMLEVLLAHGFDVNLRTDTGLTALHMAGSAASVSVLLQSGVDPFAVDKEGRGAPVTWTQRCFSRHNVTPSPEYTLSQLINAWSEISKDVDGERAIETLSPALFQFALSGRGATIVRAACKQLSCSIEDWVEPKTGRSLLRAVACHSLRSNKSALVPQISRIFLENVPPESLLAPRLDGVSDLAWCWAACRNYGTQSESKLHVDALLEILDTASPVETIKLLWKWILPLSKLNPPSILRSHKSALYGVFDGEVQALRNDQLAPVGKVGAQQGPRLQTLIDHPELMSDLARWPLGDRGAITLCSVFLAMGHTSADQDCMMAMGLLLENRRADDNAIEHIFAALESLHARGTRLPAAHPLSSDALRAIQHASRGKPRFAALASELLASRIEEETSPAPSRKSHSRL